MSDSQDANNGPPLEPNIVVHSMRDLRKTPVLVEGHDDDDDRPFMSSSSRKRKKKIAVERMQLSDGDENFFSEDSNEEGVSKVPEKRTCGSLSDGGGECRSANFSYNRNDQSRLSEQVGDVGNDKHPLIILRCVGQGSFGNPTKTLKWFNDSVFVKKLIGQISVPGRQSSSLG